MVMNFSPKPLSCLFIFLIKAFSSSFLNLSTPNISPISIEFAPTQSCFSPLFLFSNLPNPSLHNDEELLRSRATSHKKLSSLLFRLQFIIRSASSHCIVSCYRLFDVKNMFTVIRLVFLQKHYRLSFQFFFLLVVKYDLGFRHFNWLDFDFE